jgi:uncharacterized protein YggE
MQTKNLNSTILVVAVIGLLVWNGLVARPAAISAPSIQSEARVGSIRVSGSSAIRVQPNRVVVLFGVQAFASTPGAAQASDTRSSQAVVKAMRAQGIASYDIATANFSIQPRYDDYKQNVISGYLACNTIAITLRDVQQLEKVLVAALEAGATTVDGVEFSVNNLRQLRDRARDQAVQAALEKATAMADAAGMALGQVTNISEDSGNYYFGSWYSNRQWTNYQNVVQDLSSEGALVLEDGTVSLGQIVVQAQVSLTAEMEKSP